MSLSTRNRQYKDTFKAKGLLLPQVERHVMKKSMEPEEDRRQDVLHPSEICKPGWCPRHDYYRITGTPGVQKMNSMRTESIYDYGHSIHDKYQTWLWEMGVLWGKWMCLVESCEFTFFEISPPHCPVCGGPLKYKEVPIFNDDYLMSGHGDGGIRDLKAILEIKTIGTGTVRLDAPDLWQEFIDLQLTIDELWWRIKRPFPSHVRQAMLYLHFARLLYGEDEFDKIIFIYEWKANQDAREFVVKYNPRVIQRSLDGMQQVVEAKKSNAPPERPDWAQPDHRTCKACPMKKVCYGADSQADQAHGIKVVRASPKLRRKALNR